MMALLPRKLPSCLVLLVYSIVLFLILTLGRQVPWQNILPAHDPDSSYTVQVHELVRESSDQRLNSDLKSAGKGRHILFENRGVNTQGSHQKQLVKHHYHNGIVPDGVEKVARNSPPDFWTLSYEERSEVH